MSSHCQQCGKPVPNNGSDEGLCYACLMRMAAGTVGDAPLPSTLIDGSTGLPLVEGHTILEELARGGMGIVFKARQHEPAREVALKMLLPLDEHREDIRERFRVEISALAGLDHPRILPLYQSGTTPDGRPWFTMKLATGGTLAGRLRTRRKPFAPRDAATLIATMADAVHHAHSHGFLHRDIKPANILYDESGDAYLADFGLAKILDSAADLTRTLAALGTPCYMAPEVASNGAKPATTAADIYGLGAVLYELLSGRPPFIVEGYHALLKKIAEETPPRPSTLAANVPRDLELVCMTCLEKDPRLRYPSAKELADDLRRYLRGEPVAARRAGPTARLIAWARRRPALATVSAALLLTLIGSSIWLTISGIQLRRALTAEQESRTRADEQSEFLIGEFADQLEKMGRLSLIEKACEKAYLLDAPKDDAGYKRRARLLLRWASALWAKGDGTAATPKLHEALRLLEQAGPATDSADLFTRLQTTLAEVLADTNSYAGALAVIDDAERRCNALSGSPLASSLYLKATISRARAMIYNRQQDGNSGGLEPARRAVDLIRAWASESPPDSSRPVVLSRFLETLSSAYLSRARDKHLPETEKAAAAAAALAVCREAIALLEPLQNTPEPPAGALFAYAEFHDSTASALRKMGAEKASEMLAAQEKATSLYLALTQLDPANIEWQGTFANSSRLLAADLTAAGQPDAARPHREAQRKALETVHLNAPGVRRWALSLIDYNISEARAQIKLNQPEEAARQFEEALATALDRVKRQPSSRTEQDGWRNVVFAAATAWVETDEDRAVRIFQENIAATEAAATGSAAPSWLWTASALRRRLCDIYNKRKDYPAALAENLKAMHTRSRLLREGFPLAVEDPRAVANAFGNVAQCQVLTGDPAAVLQTISEALELYGTCRSTAGPPEDWAVFVAGALGEAVKVEAHAPSARALAAKALKALYPGGGGSPAPKSFKALEALAAAKTDK